MAWIAAPELIARYFDSTKGFVTRIAWLQAIACWTPLVINTHAAGTMLQNVISIAVALPCHIMAIKLLDRNGISVQT
jgi:hypothetical protein